MAGIDAGFWQTIKEVQDHATQWLWTYNNDRPNMGIGGIRPAQKLKLQTDTVVIGIIIIGVIGFAIEILMRKLEAKLIPWRGKG